MARAWLLALAVLVAGCSASAPPRNLEFMPVDDLASLAGTYRNLGEGGGDRPVYLASLLWPDDEELAVDRVETVEVATDGPEALVVTAHGTAGEMKRSRFVRGEDFELQDGRIRLRRGLGLAGLKADEPLLGPYYESTELGLDTAGDAKWSQHVTVAGLAFLIVPVAMDSREEVRFPRLGPDGPGLPGP